jgi:hypothetical protein
MFTDELYKDFCRVYLRDIEIDLFCDREEIFSEKTVPIGPGLDKYI